MSPVALAVASALVVYAVVMSIALVLRAPSARRSPLARLPESETHAGTRRAASAPGAAGAVALRRDAVGRARRGDRLLKALPRAPESFREAFLPRLVRAGYHRPDHVNALWVVSTVLAVALFVAAAVMVPRLGLEPPLSWANLVLAPLAGLYAPVLWLSGRVRARQDEIRATLPDALDLMSICLQAGLGMEQAMVRVGEELRRRRHPLGDELVLTSLQIEAGRPRPDALHALALRCDLPEVRNLVMLLSQTERLGTGVAVALRTAADTIRTRRMQRAEQAAAKTSVKTMFPVVLCMLPATLIVLAGPAVIELIRAIGALGRL